MSQQGQTPIRINAGGPVISGWEADRGCGGYTVGNSVPLGADQVYATKRYATTFDCSFGLGNGSYTISLYFMESTATGPGQRLFSVTANGQPVLAALDLFASDGLSPTKKTFSLVVSNGTLQLHFTTQTPPQAGSRSAFVNGIEIVPVPVAPPPASGLAIECKSGTLKASDLISATDRQSFDLMPNVDDKYRPVHVFLREDEKFAGPNWKGLVATLITWDQTWIPMVPMGIGPFNSWFDRPGAPAQAPYTISLEVKSGQLDATGGWTSGGPLGNGTSSNFTNGKIYWEFCGFRLP